MALFAICTQVVFVNIRVTTATISELQPGKNLKVFSPPDLFLMALLARNFLVLAHKGEIGLAVVKFAGRRKSISDVAIRTIIG